MKLTLKHLRHRLIRWLSFGDMILLNFEIRSDGSYQRRNLGPALISDAEIVRFGSDYGIYFGRGCGASVALNIAVDDDITLNRIEVRGAPLKV